MSAYLVDVVIPTYNQAVYLKTALGSLQSQQFDGWRALVIDNFSTDETAQVVSSFNDPRIGYVQFANHGIIAASRNVGIRAAAGEFIAFLDSDDWWMPQKLSRCVDLLQQQYDLVCHAEEWRNGPKTRVVQYGPHSRATYRSLLIRGNRLSTSAVVGRTAMFRDVGGFSEDESFVTAEDYELWMRLARAGYSFHFINETLGVYRMHSESASSSTQRHLLAELSVVNSHFRDESIPFALRRHRRALAHYTAARAEQRAGRTRLAVHQFLEAWRQSPLQFRIYPAMILLLLSSIRARLPRPTRK